jgi:hypothetical protein
MPRQWTVDTRTLAMGFAIIANMLIAASSYNMLEILTVVHGLQLFDIEIWRLNEAALVSLLFTIVPLLSFIFIGWLPIRPRSPLLHDPIRQDMAATAQIISATLIAVYAAIAILLLLAGPAQSVELSGFLQAIFGTLTIIYVVLLADERRKGKVFSAADTAVLVSLALFCLFFDKRELLLLGVPLLIRRGLRVRPYWVIGILSVLAAIIVFNMAVRGNLDLYQTLTRVLGNQFKYVERFSFKFEVYDQCYGMATLFSFMNRESYQAFYDLIRDPLMFVAGGQQTWWDSSNLFERLNYAYCSVNISFTIYFLFLSGFLLLEKALDDIRFFRVALLTVLFSFEGFPFYNAPMALVLCFLVCGGIWRLFQGGAAPLARSTIGSDGG